MDTQKEKKEYLDYWTPEMGKSSMKYSMSWFGWGSPVGLGLFLVEVGIFLWILHLANIIG